MILLSGATGFLGKAVLNNISHPCRSIVREDKVDDFSFYISSCDSMANYNGAFEGVSQVIHIAGVAHNKNVNNNDFEEINYKGTVNFAQQAANFGVKRFIFISTIGVNGTKTSKLPLTETSNIACVNEYTKSKYFAEQELLQIADQTSMEVVIIRPPLIYGEGAPGNFNRLVNLINKFPVLPFAMCKNKRSFISIDNLVNFIYLCIEHPKAKNEIFCISDDFDISTRDFTDAIAKGLNKKLIQIPIPISVFRILGKLSGKKDLVEQLVGDLQLDPSKAKNLLGWSPHVTMSETLSKLKANK